MMLPRVIPTTQRNKKQHRVSEKGRERENDDALLSCFCYDNYGDFYLIRKLLIEIFIQFNL
jgi:hypothetical protein